jgi:hypothetical protein
VGRVPPCSPSGLLTFVFSTILGWSYYGEKAAEYLAGPRVIVPYPMALGRRGHVGSVADAARRVVVRRRRERLMAIPNLISLIALNGVIVAETRHYLWSGGSTTRSTRPTRRRAPIDRQRPTGAQTILFDRRRPLGYGRRLPMPSLRIAAASRRSRGRGDARPVGRPRRRGHGHVLVNSTADAVDAAPGNGVLRDRRVHVHAAAPRSWRRASRRPTTCFVLVPAGVYKLTLANTGNPCSADGRTGDLNLQTRAGRTTSIVGPSGAAATIIDGNGLDGVFDVSAGAGSTTTLLGLTIRGGNRVGACRTFGGGVHAFSTPGSPGKVAIYEAVVTDNAAQAGGRDLQRRHDDGGHEDRRAQQSHHEHECP